MPNIAIFLISIFMLLPVNAISGMHKCIDSEGDTSYQSKPCAKNTKSSDLKISYKKYSKDERCQINCKGKYTICINGQIGNYYNTRGSKICRQERKACEVTCVDPEKGKLLSKLAEIERSSYESDIELQDDLDRIDRKYNRKRDKIDCGSYKRKLSTAQEEWAEIQLEWYSMETRNYYRDKIGKLKKNIRRTCH